MCRSEMNPATMARATLALASLDQSKIQKHAKGSFLPSWRTDVWPWWPSSECYWADVLKIFEWFRLNQRLFCESMSALTLSWCDWSFLTRTYSDPLRRSERSATLRFFQDGLTGSAWGDWALYTDSPLRSGVKSPGYNTLPEWEKPKTGCSLRFVSELFS